MKKFLFTTCILTVLIIGNQCATQQKTYSYYSKDNLNYNALKKLYMDVPVFKDYETIIKSILNLQNSSNYSLLDKNSIAFGVYQPLINVNGKVDAIIVNKSSNSLFDSLVIADIRRSTFRKYQTASQQISNYSLLLHYFFFNARIYPPTKRLNIETPPQPVGGFASIQQHLEYPEIARKTGQHGVVELVLAISDSGRIDNHTVVSSQGELLDKAAIKAVYKTKWIPAKNKNGQSISSFLMIPIVFAFGNMSISNTELIFFR